MVAPRAPAIRYYIVPRVPVVLRKVVKSPPAYKPLQTVLLEWFCGVFEWLSTPFRLLFVHIEFLLKPYRENILWTVLYVCIVLIVIKVLGYFILKVMRERFSNVIRVNPDQKLFHRDFYISSYCVVVYIC